MDKVNPMAVQNIRAAGTPMPGTRQDKAPTSKQAKKKSKNDIILERISRLEQGLMQLSQVLQNHEQQVRIGGLERHVSLNILEQQVGRETIQSLMEQRAPHFGLNVSYDENEKVETDEENDTNEPDSCDTNVSGSEEYEGTEEYTE